MSKAVKNSAALAPVVGQTVTWSSQAAGNETVKTGVVAQVVPAGTYPDKKRFPSLYGSSLCRKVDSYVVLVGTKVYWPLPSRLKIVDAETQQIKLLPEMKVGQSVTWVSQSGGNQTEKKGVIAQVLSPGMRPDKERFPSLYKGSGVGSPRDMISYVVMVGSKPYWPRINQMRAEES